MKYVLDFFKNTLDRDLGSIGCPLFGHLVSNANAFQKHLTRFLWGIPLR